MLILLSNSLLLITSVEFSLLLMILIFCYCIIHDFLDVEISDFLYSKQLKFKQKLKDKL